MQLCQYHFSSITEKLVRTASLYIIITPYLCLCVVVEEDYSYPSDELVISYSEGDSPVPKCLTFAILEDEILEGDHEFTVRISHVEPNWALGSPSVATVTIIDNG